MAADTGTGGGLVEPTLSNAIIPETTGGIVATPVVTSGTASAGTTAASTAGTSGGAIVSRFPG